MEGQTFVCGKLFQEWLKESCLITSSQAMFDILEADIVAFQETKIQRKDLSDDMVLVPGWDCYFSLPRHKKGNSGSSSLWHVIDQFLQATRASSFTLGSPFVHPSAQKKVSQEYYAPQAHRRASPSYQRSHELVVTPRPRNWQRTCRLY